MSSNFRRRNLPPLGKVPGHSSRSFRALHFSEKEDSLSLQSTSVSIVKSRMYQKTQAAIIIQKYWRGNRVRRRFKPVAEYELNMVRLLGRQIIFEGVEVP